MTIQPPPLQFLLLFSPSKIWYLQLIIICTTDGPGALFSFLNYLLIQHCEKDPDALCLNRRGYENGKIGAAFCLVFFPHSELKGWWPGREVTCWCLCSLCACMVHSLRFYKSTEDWTFHSGSIIRAPRVPQGQMTERRLCMVHKIKWNRT